MGHERDAEISARQTRAEIMKLDLHIHSTYSTDSLATPESIIKVARKRGLDGIAVTDHDTIKGGVETKKVCYGSDFLVIVGAEIFTEKGDILGLFLEKEIQAKTCEEVIEEIHSQGGIAILPHPFKLHKLDEKLLSEIDAIEIFNSRTSSDDNTKALMLAKQYGKPMVAGSDAHFCMEIGRAMTIIEGPDVKKALLAGTSRTEGEQTHRYIEGLSQLMKFARTKEYAMMPRLICSAMKKRTLKN
jgi:predicted metal-dependent phosphoesterase TrpH